ncbi:ABC transporter ATP-binding protein [Bacillus kwashiorkori]|uniref:ABC transporter ATP-binding protein n=1 Tax=Bacillus kwashiorkori TaxID=1522318 RepID=UPI000781ECEF|nr:ABC transporter ATP-binding protein [Bacillus kwashiorkori]
MEPILATEELTIKFGGHTAVDHVSLELYERQFTSIIGPNGAGKTTFFNLLSGQLPATSGEVFFKGENITKLSPAKRTRKGIGRSFQLTNVFPNLTVLENVRLAVQSQLGIRYQMFQHFFKYADAIKKAQSLLQLVLLDHKPFALAKHLTHGEQRKLEIAMLLALETDILLLDEPTAGMSLEDVPQILEVIRNIKEDGNKTIVLIEHKMDLILDLSDRVIVLFNGTLLADGSPQEIMDNDTVQSAYLGSLYDTSTS